MISSKYIVSNKNIIIVKELLLKREGDRALSQLLKLDLSAGRSLSRWQHPLAETVLSLCSVWFEHKLGGQSVPIYKKLVL